MKFVLSVALAATSFATLSQAQGLFTDTGAESFYWHNRYHAILAMAAYGDPNVTCRNTFTTASLASNYPDSTEEPFQFLGTFGPTPKYGVEGYTVKVPEMNKILMVFKDVYGWQNFNATLAPLTGVGCDTTCMAHAGAIEAWAEVKNATNDMQVIKDNQGNFVWSASGHGFGGMVAQIGAMDLKYRTFAYSCMTFGSPAVFNAAAVAAYNALFPAEDSQRTVSHNDSIVNAIPIKDYSYNSTSEYTFVDTGVHLFGTNPMYGQDYTVCYDPLDPDCHGGEDEEDHYFYYTAAGSCGESSYTETYNTTNEVAYLSAVNASYMATAAAAIGTPVTSGFVAAPTTTSSSSVAVPTSTAVPTGSVDATADAANDAAASASATITPASAGSSLTIGLSAIGAVLVSAVMLLL